jgi:hypothetical protein
VKPPEVGCLQVQPVETIRVPADPDFGLRLSRWQGLDILGPIAVIARNAQTVLGGFEAIARYLYIHSPALTLTIGRGSAQADVQATYEVTEPGVPYPLQGYELSMGIGVGILHLLGGPEARPRVISFMHNQQGSDAAHREALGCPVRFGQTWCGLRCPRVWPTGASTTRIRRPGASPRNTWSPPTCRAPRRCPSALRS